MGVDDMDRFDSRLSGRSRVGLVGVMVVALAGAVVPSARASVAAPTVTVVTPGYDAPGGVAAAVVSVSHVPAGYAVASLTVKGKGPAAVSCVGASWVHGGGTVSKKCFVTLPKTPGQWMVTGQAVLSKKGAVNRTVTSKERLLAAQGSVTSAVSASVRDQIERCYNTTRNVWLTFDDGYTSQANLNSILGTLRAQNIRAHFFLIGDWARANPRMVAQIRAAGHYLENHSKTHASLNQISALSVRSEIAYGGPSNTSPKLLRPPYGAGALTTRLYHAAASQGFKLCHWTTDSSDWSGLDAAGIVNKVVNGDWVTEPARPGGVVLMHLNGRHTAQALPTVIKDLRARHLSFDTLPQGAPAPGPSSTPLLQLGSRGSAVAWVQARLALRPVDGIFGPITRAGVIGFQRAHHLVPDGVVGTITWRALRSP